MCFTVAVMTKHVLLDIKFHPVTANVTVTQTRTNKNIVIYFHQPRKWNPGGFTLLLMEVSPAGRLLHERANDFSLGCFLNEAQRHKHQDVLQNFNLKDDVYWVKIWNLYVLPLASRLQFILQVSRLILVLAPSHIKLVGSSNLATLS